VGLTYETVGRNECDMPRMTDGRTDAGTSPRIAEEHTRKPLFSRVAIDGRLASPSAAARTRR